MIVYGMNGFVQELQQTLKSNGIIEHAEHFQSLGNHIKDREVYALKFLPPPQHPGSYTLLLQSDTSFVSRDVQNFVRLLVTQFEVPEVTLRWLQNGASDEEKRSLTIVLSSIAQLLLEQSDLLSKRASFREITFLENSVPNFLRFLISESTIDERLVVQRLFRQLVNWRFEKYFLDGHKTDLLSDWLVASDDFESVQQFVQTIFKLKHWYKRDELFRHIKKVPIFKKVSIEAIKALVSNVTLKLSSSEEVIVTEGEVGNEMFFVIEGFVVVLDKGEQVNEAHPLKKCKVIAELGPGSYFGEIVLLEANNEVFNTRTRTVVTKTECELYILQRDQFEVVMNIYPELRWSINEEAAKRRMLLNESEKEALAKERSSSVLEIQQQALQEIDKARTHVIEPQDSVQIDMQGLQKLEFGRQLSSTEAITPTSGIQQRPASRSEISVINGMYYHTCIS